MIGTLDELVVELGLADRFGPDELVDLVDLVDELDIVVGIVDDFKDRLVNDLAGFEN